jgi:hypothetical protein
MKEISGSTAKSRCDCKINTIKFHVKIKRVSVIPLPHSVETIKTQTCTHLPHEEKN